MLPKEEFEKSFKVTKFCLLLSGAKADQNIMSYNKFIEYFINNWLFYFNIVWLYVVVIGELWWMIEGIKIGRNFEEVILMIPCSAMCILGTARVTRLYFRRDLMIELVERLKDIHPETDDKNGEIDDNNEEIDANKLEKKITNETIRHFSTVVSLFYVMSIPIMITFCLVPMLLMMYDYLTVGEYEIRLPFSAKYFFDTSKGKLWMLPYFHQVTSASIVVVNMTGADTLYYASCSFTQMHFKILRLRLENLIDSQWDHQIKITVNIKMKNFIRRHQMLIQTVTIIDQLYSYSSLFNLVASSLLICLSGFILSMTQDHMLKICFATFTFTSLCQIAIVCYGGDLIMHSSQALGQAVYNSRWYLADEPIKRNLFIMLMRCQKPCKLTAGSFFDLNLRAYARVLNRSWSYFALLRTMLE